MTETHYDPVTPVENIFNKIEYLIHYGEMAICPYQHLQAISEAYNIFNKTGKFRESIKSWNCIPLTEKKWIAFKTYFREDHE